MGQNLPILMKHKLAISLFYGCSFDLPKKYFLRKVTDDFFKILRLYSYSTKESFNLLFLLLHDLVVLRHLYLKFRIILLISINCCDFDQDRVSTNNVLGRISIITI